ncbi:MAG: hypothetical protein MZV64_43030 [Ignavibacteriales bacterium]|nr:hypothetical protein [Ignavibacteriales bacterium]
MNNRSPRAQGPRPPARRPRVLPTAVAARARRRWRHRSARARAPSCPFG